MNKKKQQDQKQDPSWIDQKLEDVQKDWNKFKDQMFNMKPTKIKTTPEQKQQFKDFMNKFRGGKSPKASSLIKIKQARSSLRVAAKPFWEDKGKDEYGENWSEFINKYEKPDLDKWQAELEHALRASYRESDLDYFSWAEIMFDDPTEEVANLLDQGFEKFTEDQAHDTMINIMKNIQENQEDIKA